MTATDREQVRWSLLRLLEQWGTRSRWGIATAQLLQAVRSEGLAELKRPDIEGELEYLAGKGWVENVAKPLSPELRCWKLTAAGRDLVAERGE